MDGLVLSANFDTHTNVTYTDTKEFDMVLSYDHSDTLNLTAIYSDIDDNNEAFTNVRIFVNYNF